MARKSGKRGSAIIVLMVVAAIAGSPATATAAPGKSQAPVKPQAPAPVNSQSAVHASAPAVLAALGIGPMLDASWAEASWAEE